MELDEVVKFHGHLCPGLVMGYRVAKYAEELFKDRPEDEELVVVIENRSCAADAVQMVNGCTFGKGNLVFRDYGKHVYTFFKRGDEEGVRISVNSIPRPMDDVHKALFAKVRSGEATEEEHAEFRKRHEQRARALLDIPAEDMFSVTKVKTEPPQKAMVYQSIPCEQCGEDVMETRLRVKEGKKVCLSCFEGYDI